MSDLIDFIAEENPDALICDGFDDAIIGMASRIGLDPVVAYSVTKIIEILMKDGMTDEEAIEYFEFNIIGAWMGAGTPIFIRDIDI